ncbi:DUF5667 domain-containing protein, partial [Streptomyces sp. NPDC026673]|uniref:DUF5667 domain-containing protein n=1 Tax=Streptomyces sp. NPDC026673 TaxID=3155724 RepID=UPI0033C29692
MTEHAHQAQPDEQLDPAVADRLAAAQAYLRAHSPLLTPQARASMLQRVRQQAAAAEVTAAQLAHTAQATAPAAQPSRSDDAPPVQAAGSLLTLQRTRRAQAFAEALADASAGTHADEQHDTYVPDREHGPDQGGLVALADALQGMPRPMLNPETRTVQRAQLIAAMEAALADGTLTVPEQPGKRATHRRVRRNRPRSAWSRAIAAGGLSVGVAAGALGGVAASSTDALPGDTLYGLKRGMEDMRLNLADDDADRGKVYLDLASTRLQEARRLMERG